MVEKVIIDNRVGEPDLDFIPPHMRVGKLPRDLHDAAKYGYDLDRRGMKRTLHAIVADFNHKNNSDITEANIVLASGARAAASSAILRVLGNIRRAELGIMPTVLLMEPGYNLYKTQFEGFGFKLDFVNLLGAKTDEEKLALIKENITHETLFLPICNPNNPTGEIYSKEFLHGILELLKDFPNLHILNDSIYDRIARNDIHVPNIFALANNEQRKRVFEVNALSKLYSYPAIRAGWLIGDEQEIKAIQNYKDAQFGPLNNIGQLITIAALEQTEEKIPDYFAQVNKIYNQRLEFVHDKLHQIKGFKSEIPAGSFYYWADLSFIKDIVSKLETRGILVSDGAKFGAPGFVRINCGAKAKELAVICDAIVEIAEEQGLDVSLKEISLPKKDLPDFAE